MFKAIFSITLLIGISLCQAEDVKPPKLFLSLPNWCNTPDGMTLDADDNIILAVPNFNDPSYPGVLVKINKERQFSVLCTLPVHPETKRACPMGLDFVPDGHIYYADNQYFYDKNYKSRLMRVIMKNGKAQRVECVATGFKLANAVIWKDKHVFVSDTFLDVPNKPGMSGIVRLSLDEMNQASVTLKPSHEDPHIIATFTSKANERGDLAGADGLTFDAKGNLYTGNFGDGVISKISFNEKGNVTSNKIINREITCCDGIFYNKANNLIYIADSAKNAIHTMTLEGKLTTLWKNGDDHGADGLLDQPCEVLIRGKELIIVNMDFASPDWKLTNPGPDKHHTLSIIQLP